MQPRLSSLDRPSYRESWATRFWTCGGSWDICCLGAFCPCLLYARNKAEIDLDDRECRNCFLFCCTPCCVSLALGLVVAKIAAIPHVSPCLVAAMESVRLSAAGAALAFFATPLRRRLREREGLAEAPCPDLVAWFFCSWCAVCQEAALLKEHRMEQLEMARHGEGKMVVEPPMLQRMECDEGTSTEQTPMKLPS